MKRRILAAGLAAVMALNMSMTAFAGTWETVGSDWKYKNDDGAYSANTWQWIDGKSYYFGADGIMAKGTTVDGYTVNADGQWVVNGIVQTQGSTGQTTSANGVNHSEGYDPAHPLKNVIDQWNLRLSSDKNFLNYHYICDNDNIHALLTGQMEYYNVRTGYNADEDNSTEQAIYQWLCNWLNSFDFEHMTEMERAQEIQKVVQFCSYDNDYKENKTSEHRDAYYSILINKKGICIEFAQTACCLAEVLGLKTCYVGNMEHANYIIQVDGTAYLGSNNVFNLITKGESSGHSTFNWFN